MSAAAPLPLPAAPAVPALDTRAVTVEDLAPLRADLVMAQRLLDELLWSLRDAASDAPVCTPEAQRGDIERVAAELRALLHLSAAKVDALAALVRLAHDRRAHRAHGTRKAGRR